MKVRIVLLLSLLFVGPLGAESLRIVTEDFPPYNYQVGDEARGLSSEMVLAVMSQINRQAAIEFFPWARAYDIAPYKTSPYKLKANKSIQVNSIEEAKKYQIGVLLNDVTLAYLQRHDFPSLNTVSKDVLNIRLLANNRIDLIAYDEAFFIQKVKIEGLNPSMFERVFRLDELSDQLYMAFSPGSNTKLISEFRDGLKAIKISGNYDRIQARYLNLE